MKKSILNYSLTLITAFGISNCTTPGSEEGTDVLTPPVAEKIEKQLTNLGDTRIDNYYWMRLSDEQKNAETSDEQTKKVKNYLESENVYLNSVMIHTEDLQKDLYDEIVGRIKKTDESVPYFTNGYWYYTRYEEGGEYPIYCRKKGSLESEEQVMLNVNEMAVGYAFFNVGRRSISKDNKWLAYGVDTISRRIYTLHFKNLETGELSKESIPKTTGSAAWANDNKTIFYTSKNEITLLSEKIFRHELASDHGNDEMVYHEMDNTFSVGVYKTKSDKFIVIRNGSTLVNDYWILDADDPKGKFKSFSPRETKHEYSIDHFKDKFYIVTNWDADNFRLMETPDTQTEKENWTEVIAHREDVLLQSIEMFNNYMVVREREAGLTNLRIINQASKEEHYLDFGEEAYVSYISTNPEFDTNILRYGYSSLTTPNSTYDYNMDSKEKELKKRQEVVGGHNPEDYETKRFYAEARDGVQVPITIVHKKGMQMDGNNPTLLYGYGSYGNSIDPFFSSTRLSLLDRGFIYAIAHVRGGQEMGRKWYEDGKIFTKKNTFYDFIDCGRYLVAENYTNPDMLFAYGGSAGGLLMGAVANLAPELFKGIIAAVPFVDVVTTMLDESIPLTTGEFDEWGNPKDLESYQYMLSYSPYDQVSAQDYPNMLVTTGFFDSQVQYWEPAKWVAKLRDMKTDNNLLLLYTNMEVGHGGASGRFERYKITALQYAFLIDLAEEGETL